MNKQNLVGALAVVALLVSVFGLYRIGTVTQALNAIGAAGVGPTHYQTENFLQGLYAGTAGQFYVDSTGATRYTSSTVTSLTVGTSTYGNVGGTAGTIQGIRCVTQDYDPPSLGTGATSSVQISAPGFTNGTASGTVAFMVGVATSTGDVQFWANASGTVTSSVAVVNFRSASGTKDIGNAAVTVCAISK